MTVNNIKHIIWAAVTLLLCASCSMMTEEEPDCNPYFKVKFIFDRNMLYADAFSSQVEEVDLYIFNSDGNLVWKGHEEGAALKDEEYMMDLPVSPGKYRMLAWCRKRHENASDFILDETSSLLRPEDYKMRLDRRYDGSTAHSSTDLHALFHGSLTNVELPDSWGTHVVKMPLTKNTNTLRIMLVHLSGKEIKEGDFDFKITDSNGYLDHDNTILDDEPVEYRPWIKQEGLAQTVLPVNNESRATTQVHSLMAEMTTSRLQTCRQPMLTVTRKTDNENVINIPLLDYLMKVKGEYHKKMTDDEYLDRQDEYTMTFFMNEDGSWYKAVMDILSWRVVLQGEDL